MERKKREKGYRRDREGKESRNDEGESRREKQR